MNLLRQRALALVTTLGCILGFSVLAAALTVLVVFYHFSLTQIVEAGVTLPLFLRAAVSFLLLAPLGGGGERFNPHFCSSLLL